MGPQGVPGASLAVGGPSVAAPGRALWAGNFVPVKLALSTQTVMSVLLHAHMVCVLPASPPSDCSQCDSGPLARQLVPRGLKLNLLPQPEHVAPMLPDLGNAQNQQAK